MELPIHALNIGSIFVLLIQPVQQSSVLLTTISQWRIQDGAFGANAPLPNLVEEPAIATSD